MSYELWVIQALCIRSEIGVNLMTRDAYPMLERSKVIIRVPFVQNSDRL